jgi:hypothetical protein
MRVNESKRKSMASLKLLPTRILPYHHPPNRVRHVLGCGSVTLMFVWVPLADLWYMQ